MPFRRLATGTAALAVFLFLTSVAGFAAVVSLPDQTAARGQTLVASVSFSAESQNISGLQFDLVWDEGLELKAAIGGHLRSSSKLLYASEPGTRMLRCLFIGPNNHAAPDGELLTVFLLVSPTAKVGTAQIRFANPAATDFAGTVVPLRAAPVNVRIQEGAFGTSLPPQAILNSASLASGPIAPGEIVTLFGNIPAAPTLWFNGTAGTILYAGAGQLNAVTPFGLDATAPAAVELRAGDTQTISRFTTPTASVAPAIFSQTGIGNGPGAILNEDYSVNAYDNPARGGSVVMIYGTGFGALTPPAVDGQPAEGLASTTNPVIATIGGLDAEVIYAGAAPGLIAGLAQINLLVPAGAGPDPAAPIVLRIGSARTAAGITISVR